MSGRISRGHLFVPRLFRSPYLLLMFRVVDDEWDSGADPGIWFRGSGLTAFCSNICTWCARQKTDWALRWQNTRALNKTISKRRSVLWRSHQIIKRVRTSCDPLGSAIGMVVRVCWMAVSMNPGYSGHDSSGDDLLPCCSDRTHMNWSGTLFYVLLISQQ